VEEVSGRRDASPIAWSLKESKRRRIFLLLYAGGNLGLKSTRTVVGWYRRMLVEREEICHRCGADRFAYTSGLICEPPKMHNDAASYREQ
jgi:hypothetical protein